MVALSDLLNSFRSTIWNFRARRNTAYKPHPAFQEPDDQSVQVWRYIDFPQLISILENESLHFTRLDSLTDDPFEGVFPIPNIEMAEARREEQNEQIREMAVENDFSDEMTQKLLHSEDALETSNFPKQITFVNCWHRNEYESMAMWKTYGGSDGGIAIRSTFDRLKRAFCDYDGNDVYLGKVDYVDHREESIESSNQFRSILSKPIEFKSEQEVRAVISDLQTPEDYSLKPGASVPVLQESKPAGLSASVSLNQLIESIFISPASPDWHQNLVNNLLRKYGIDKPVIKSDLRKQPNEYM